MNNAIHTTTTAASSPPSPPVSATSLGMAPLKKATLRFFGFGLGGVFLGFSLVGAGHGPAFLVIIGALPWLCYMLFLGVRLVVMLTSGGGSGFRRVKDAVEAGKISVSYFIRGEDHILVIDEPKRLLCLDGEMFSFDEIKRLTMNTVGFEHRLIILMNSGVNPIRHLSLSTRDLEIAYARLGNSLGFT